MLLPWQREQMRWVRINLGHTDFTREERIMMCEQLCMFWAGSLQGLRIRVKAGSLMRVSRRKNPWKRPEKDWWWLDRGVKRLIRLRRLEVEWCGKLDSYY
jgi:hypothetical protein